MALSRFTAASVLTCLVCFTTAYPTGAPNAACNNFRPNHVNGQTGQRFAPQNGEQQTQQTGSDDDCPYTVKFSGKYLPGQPITLNITVEDSRNFFRGYMLSVVDSDDVSGLKGVGQFGVNSKAICQGKAVTHKNSDEKRSELIQWTAPAGATKKYAIWMTVVHSHSRFWLNCSPIEVPAFGSDDTGRGPTTTTITTQRSIVATSAETVTAKDEHVHNKHGNSHENGSSHEHHNKKKNSSKSKDDDASEDSKDSSVSSEDLNSVGKDDSGDSDENSIDVSNNLSGSSLQSAEKKIRRTKYLDKGIKNVNGDIKKFLTSIGQAELYKSFKHNSASSLSASFFTGFVLVVISKLF